MRLWALFTVCVMALAGVSPAAAQEDAREAFRKGEAAYSVGNYELAIQEWERAYSIDPRPRIQFNLAQAHERLGQWPQAVEALKLYLQNADPDDPTYADANARLSSLQQRLSKTGLILDGGLEGGIIKVDDKEWGRTPRPDKIPVTPGAHQVVVDWGDGRPSFTASVVVPPGQVAHVTVLTPKAPEESSTKPEPAMPPPAEKPDNRLSNGLLIGAGAAGALMIGSLVYFIDRQQEYNRIDGCGEDYACSQEDVDSIADDAGVTVNDDFDLPTNDDLSATTDKIETQRMIGIIGTAVFGAAAVGLAVGGVLTRNKEPKADRRATRCAFGFTGGMCQVSF